MTGESVEQALAAAVLPAPWGSMLSALEALDRLGDSRYYALRDVFRTQADKIETLENENGELRDGMLALSNRIESLTQACNTNLEKQLETLSDHVGRIRTLEQASLL